MTAVTAKVTEARLSAAVARRPAASPIPLSLATVVWRRRWTVALTTLACVGGAAAYLRRATPIYTSTSRLMIESAGSRLLSSDAGREPARADSYLFTQGQVLTSTPILTRALARLDVAHMRTFRNTARAGGPAGAETPLQLLRSRVRAEVGRRDDLITVSMDSESPAEAADVVNAVVDAYVAFASATQRTGASAVSSVLVAQRDATERETSAKMDAMLAFKRENGALSFQNRDGNLVLDRLSALQQSLTQCELDAAQATAEYDVGRAILADPAAVRRFVQAQMSRAGASIDPEYTTLRETLERYDLALEQALLARGEDSDTVRGYRATIAKMRADVADRERRFAEAHLAELDQLAQAARAKEATIRRAFDAQERAALDLNAKATEYARLEGDYNRLQETAKQLDWRIKDAEAASDAGGLNIQVLEVAWPTDRPTQPRSPVVLAVSLLAGLTLGAGTALWREGTRRTLHTAEEAAVVTNLPVLGLIPHVRGRAAGATTAEACRTIRTAVQFGARQGAPVKTLLVTSPAPGDGKSMLARNLAIAFAQAGHRTLLVDCDLRKPSQQELFDLPARATGLTHVVDGQARLAECIHPTDTARLSVLPCGPLPTHPSELLGGKRFSRVLAAVVGAYDKVVIDSPPVGAVTDACILAAQADATLLVVRAARSTDRQAAGAIDTLRGVGAALVGVVVNDVGRRADAYGYYGYLGPAGGPRIAAIATDVTADPETMPDVGLNPRLPPAAPAVSVPTKFTPAPRATVV